MVSLILPLPHGTDAKKRDWFLRVSNREVTPSSVNAHVLPLTGPAGQHGQYIYPTLLLFCDHRRKGVFAKARLLNPIAVRQKIRAFHNDRNQASGFPLFLPVATVVCVLKKPDLFLEETVCLSVSPHPSPSVHLSVCFCSFRIYLGCRVATPPPLSGLQHLSLVPLTDLRIYSTTDNPTHTTRACMLSSSQKTLTPQRTSVPSGPCGCLPLFSIPR